MPPNPTPRRRAPPEARRAQILEAALRCFSEKGFHAATMDDLVLASGLSKGSLYWHFRSKEEVFLALYEGFEVELFEVWEDVARSSPTVLDGLRRLGERTLQILLEERAFLLAWAEFLVHPSARERFARIYERSRQRLATWLREGIERGDLAPLDADGLAAGLVATVDGLLLQAMVDPEFDARRHWLPLWQMVRRGLAP